MKFRGWLTVFVLSALPTGVAWAEASPMSEKGSSEKIAPEKGSPAKNAPPSGPQDAVAWLHWMAKSASEAAFAGTYVHQYDSRLETLRVVHVTDHQGEHEKLEALDGAQREIIRTNEEITCYIPDSKVVKLELKRTRKFFPALIGNVADITDNYTAKLGVVERVAGFDCQVVVLEPKDKFRFGHRFCGELASGLMLRATMVSDQNEVLEQFAFTQLALGSQVKREQVKSAYSDMGSTWKTDNSALQNARPIDSGWYAESLPPGFRKILEVKRKMAGKTEPVIQQIYSDGLASVSVFIEGADANGKPPAELIQQGNYKLYVRPLPEQPFSIKVLGEVPGASLRQIGNSLVSPPR